MPRGVSRVDEARLQGRLWQPSAIRPTLWLDAADPSTITIATGVSEWRDKSGSGNHFSQATSGIQPAYSIGTANGNNVVFFDGTKNLNRGTITFNDGDTSLYCVGNRTGRQNQFNVAVMLSRASGRTRGVLFDFAGVRSWGTYTGGEVRSPALTTVGADYDIFELFSNGTANNYNFYRAGVNEGTAGVVNQNTLFGATSYIGNDQYGSALNGNVAEVVFFDNRNSDPDRWKVEGYLSWKWNLPLIATHPYANRPPLIGD
jgi:hypothetical protein